MQIREPRTAVILPARLRLHGRWTDVRIRNISSRGMLVEISHPPPPGNFLEIARGTLRYTARVAWSGDGQCGVQIRETVRFEEISTQQANHRYAEEAYFVPAKRSKRVPDSHTIARLTDFGMMAAALSVAAMGLGLALFDQLSEVAHMASDAMAGERVKAARLK